MINRRRFWLTLSSLAMGTLAIALPGCGGGDSTPQGQATPNEFLDADESGSPPDASSKPVKKKAR